MVQYLQQHFVFYSALIGLIAWGVPGVLLFPEELFALFSYCLVGYVLMRVILMRKTSLIEGSHPSRFPDLVFFSAILFLIVDASVGRQAYLENLFFVSDSVGIIIEAAEEGRGQGRGFFELLGTIFLFCPFFLFDFGKRASVLRKFLFIVMAFLLVMNEVKGSRGYLLMAVLSLALAGRHLSLRQLFFATGLAICSFILSSWFRGDFDTITYSNPLFDGIAWPYVNLGLFLSAECGDASYMEYLKQILQKIVPSFIYTKEILSFNVEVSECIYNMSLEDLGSISVFTYLAELKYYKPSILVAATAGAILCFASTKFDSYFSRNRLYSTQIFVGFFVILLLRSRILDVLSIFIALILFIWFVGLLDRRFFGMLVPQSNKAVIRESLN